MLIVGVAFNIHDSSVTIAEGRHVRLVLEAERYFRRKKMRCSVQQMEILVEYALSEFDRCADDVDTWIMTALNNPLIDVLKSQPMVKSCAEILGRKREVWIVNHHLAHAASSLALGEKSSIIYVSDGGGDFREKNRTFLLRAGRIEPLAYDPQFEISGSFYQHCASFLFGEFHCEGSMMALAAYGQPRADFFNLLWELAPRLERASTMNAVRMLTTAFREVAGCVRVDFAKAADIAASAQSVFNAQRTADVVEFFKSEWGGSCRSLVLAGGTCLNVTTNRSIMHEIGEEYVKIAPCCDDTGQSLGAVLAYMSAAGILPSVSLPFLGRGVDSNYDDLTVDQAVEHLVKGGILALHTHREEIGPRALGHRSLLCSPVHIDTAKKLSTVIKHREWYRPVAPIVLREYLDSWFDTRVDAPYMLHCAEAKERTKKSAPAVVHADGTSRLQTVEEDSSDVRYRLLDGFRESTGIPMLVNTSLNSMGEPICSTENDTKRFMKDHRSDELVALVNGRFLKDRGA